MLTAEAAIKILDSEMPLMNQTVAGVLQMVAGEEWPKSIFIESCNIENLNCIMVQFSKHVTIKNSYLRKASFNFSYFLGGLTIENCVFDEYLDFEAGGHNCVGTRIVIKDSHFHGFVNFFDCWFVGDVSIYNNTFESGTNILSKKQLISFEIFPSLQNNIGILDVEGECRKE